MNLLSLRTLIGSTYVELKLHKKSLLKTFCYKNKGSKKVKKKLSSNSTNQNTNNLSNSLPFHSIQTSLKEIKLSVLKSGIELLLVCLINVLMGIS